MDKEREREREQERKRKKEKDSCYHPFNLFPLSFYSLSNPLIITSSVMKLSFGRKMEKERKKRKRNQKKKNQEKERERNDQGRDFLSHSLITTWMVINLILILFFSKYFLILTLDSLLILLFLFDTFLILLFLFDTFSCKYFIEKIMIGNKLTALFFMNKKRE